MPNYTSAKEFEEGYSTLFHTFSTNRTKSLAWRKWQLKQCWWMITENEDRILKALSSDLNRHEFESHTSDLLGMKMDILEHITHLEEWAADSKPDNAGFIFGTLGKAKIRNEPLGVALIIGAWNFPFLLLLQPLLAAIAAGCCVILKPSELSVVSQDLLVELVPKYLDQSAIRLVTGGPQETGRILEHKFNHIFFTGSSKVARFITAAAAKHLTPTVLELGGQGPAIVTKTANVDLAAKRIAAGKFQNAGQICLTINHVFAEPEVHDKLVERLAYWFDKFLGEDEGIVKIVNERNFDRLTTLLDQSQGKIVYGGRMERSRTFIAPTVVTGVTMKDSLLAEELFGPILPIVKADYKTSYQAISSEGHPLAIYIFTHDEKVANEILDNTNSGGVTINDVIMHAGVPNAPFGGVGESGYGSYHGKHGFLAFTHQRVVLAMPEWLDAVLSFRYPPYDLKHLPKIAVKNKLNFKRGETLADQKIKSTKGHGALTKGLSVAVLGVGAVVVFKSLTGNKTVVEESLLLWGLLRSKVRSVAL